jgi:folate-binding protein YgfZ
MTDWKNFLARLSGPAGQDSRPCAAAENGFVVPLDDLGLIGFSGDEAAVFLHGQLTNDVLHLGLQEARLAGYCSPKGRLLATMLMWRSAQGIVLEVARDLQGSVQKRLQMYVLRAKVKITDVTDDYVVLGVGGSGAGAVLTQWFPNLPSLPHTTVDGTAGMLIRVADGLGQPRYQWITTPTNAMAMWPALTARLRPADTNLWRFTEIAACVPHITLPTQEKFVPQMVNLEAIGGVNFKKGCYPGQEIVARSQYLGKLKRRMLPATVTAPDVAAGMEVFAVDDPQQPCGMIVNAAQDIDGLTHCLVEIKTVVAESAAVHLLGVDGPKLNFSALPYPLPDTV